jgi:hypothetical protein
MAGDVEAERFLLERQLLLERVGGDVLEGVVRRALAGGRAEEVRLAALPVLAPARVETSS